MQALTVPLTRYGHEFPAPEALHAFERALLELTVGEERYVTALDRVAALRKPLSEVCHGRTPKLTLAIAALRAPHRQPAAAGRVDLRGHTSSAMQEMGSRGLSVHSTGLSVLQRSSATHLAFETLLRQGGI